MDIHHNTFKRTSTDHVVLLSNWSLLILQFNIGTTLPPGRQSGEAIGKLRKIGVEEVKGSSNIMKRLPGVITSKLKLYTVDSSETVSFAFHRYM